MHKNVAAILNFIIWGSGYLYIKKNTLGVIWLVAYAFSHLSIYYLGWVYTFTKISGILTLIGHIVISFALAYDVYKK